MVGRAVVDGEFRMQLLASPAKAAGGYDLSEFERRLLKRIRAESLAEFASALEALLNPPSGPGRRRPAAPIWQERRASA